MTDSIGELRERMASLAFDDGGFDAYVLEISFQLRTALT